MISAKEARSLQANSDAVNNCLKSIEYKIRSACENGNNHTVYSCTYMKEETISEVGSNLNRLGYSVEYIRRPYAHIDISW